MQRKKMILVAGSVNMNIISKVNTEDDVLDSPGSVDISIGGSAGNVAIDLMNLGESVRLLSAMNNSAYSNVIKKHLEILGVDMFVVTDKNLPLAAFVAQVNQDGTIRSAMSSMPVEHCQFSQEVIDEALDEIDLLVMDCNLSSENLLSLANAARKKDIPIYLITVSEAKAIRALALMDSENLLSGVFCSEKDAVRLLNFSGLRSFEELSEFLGTLVFTTNTGKVVISQYGEKIFVIEDSPIVVKNGDYIGIIDLLVAETIGFLVRGNDLEHSVLSAASKVSQISRRQNFKRSDAIEQIMSQTQAQSQYDGLTGLLNRAAIQSSCNIALSGAKRNRKTISMILIDIDRFKNVNDTMGHDVGDFVLSNFAGILKQVFRESDIVGRWGGEEFLIIMVGADLDQAIEKGNRIRKVLIADKDMPCRITISGGIVEFDQLCESFAEAIKRADRLLYAAKFGGRDRIYDERQLNTCPSIPHS